MRVSTGRGSGGRPTAQAAAQLEATILDNATNAFLTNGYAATSIEAVARNAGVAKRTIYARWSGKPALFRAVVERLMAQWMTIAGDWPPAHTLEAALQAAAASIMAVALTPEAIALHRLLIAESLRFPELPVMLRQAGAAEGNARIARILKQAISDGALPPLDTDFAAEQFLNLLLAGPQRRALGLGPTLNQNQLDAWRDATVALYLAGIINGKLPRGSH